MSDRAPIRCPAAFAPTTPPTPRCPVCWSAPLLSPTRSVRRGWRVQAGVVEATPGSVVSVASTVYPCSNPDCRTAIVVRIALTGGYLAADVAEHLLRDANAASFTRGRTKRDGVWRDRAGDPRTAPEQRELFPVARVPAARPLVGDVMTIYPAPSTIQPMPLAAPPPFAAIEAPDIEPVPERTGR